MTVLLALVPLALALGLAGLFAFLWALRNDQYADLDGAAVRMLSDDDLAGERAAGGRPAGEGGRPRRSQGSRPGSAAMNLESHGRGRSEDQR